MTQCDLDKASSGAAAGRADVIAAIEGLVKEVAHLAIRIKHLVAMANAANSELAEQAVSPGATRPVAETVEQTVLKATSAATACDPQALEMAEAVMFPLSPEQDCMDKASSGEANLIDELTSKLEVHIPRTEERKLPGGKRRCCACGRTARTARRVYNTFSLPRPPHQTS